MRNYLLFFASIDVKVTIEVVYLDRHKYLRGITRLQYSWYFDWIWFSLRKKTKWPIWWFDITSHTRWLSWIPRPATLLASSNGQSNVKQAYLPNMWQSFQY